MLLVKMVMKKHCDVCDKVIESIDRFYSIQTQNHLTYGPAKEFRGIVCLGCAKKPINSIEFS